jgi:7-cyano-7-deazaguanine synthase
LPDPNPSAPIGAPIGALVLFSGGQDSSVCLAWALDRYTRVETLGFDYGQRHAVELEARQVVRAEIARRFPAWAGRLGADHMLDIRGFGAIGETAMTDERAIEITERGLPSTFVPGRNLIFLTYAAALADRLGLKALVGGMCETDFSGYPDCRRRTMDAMETVLELGIDRPFPIKTPLMKISKADTWAMAKALGGEDLVELIRVASHTCYLGQRETLHEWGYGCGECPACELRANGWRDWVGQGRPTLAP